jgi:hypothetical protein
MKLPQTPEDVKTEILISSDKSDKLGDLRIRQLIKIMATVDSKIIVEGIIKVFEIENRPDKLYQDQEFAGTIVRTINPKSQKDLEGFLKRTLDNWDKSVEELPFWFRDNYGLEKVKNTFNKVGWAESQRDKLETMKFWLQLKEEEE